VLDGCPLKPTAIAASGPWLHTAVFNGAVQPTGVLYSRSADGGKSFGEAVKLHPEATVSDAPALAASGDHAFAFWHAKVGTGERRVYGRILSGGGTRLGPVFGVGAGQGASSLPAAASSEDGGALVVWQQGEQVVSARLPPPTAAAAPVATQAAAPVARLTADGFSSLLERQRGQFVVLNLWATWCVACLREIPDLVALSRELAPRGVQLLAVSMDEPSELARVETFRQRVFPEFSSWLRAEPDMDTLVSRIDPAWNELLPTTYLIGRDGQVLKRLQGKKSLEDFRGEIAALL
jgi:thiol-disulfide isomerase/thioredoxin